MKSGMCVGMEQVKLIFDPKDKMLREALKL